MKINEALRIDSCTASSRDEREHEIITAMHSLANEVYRLRSIMARIARATPHSMCYDAEAYMEAESYIELAKKAAT